MDNNESDSISFKHSFAVINKKKWLIVCCVIGVLTPIILYNYISSPTYEAKTMVIYEDRSRSLPISFVFPTSFGKSLINDQVKEIKSFSLSRDVVAALPESIKNSYPLPKKRKPDFNLENYLSKEIQKRISTNTSMNSNIIEIKVEAFTAEAAMVVTNAVAEVLKERNIRVKKQETSNVLNMIEEQLKAFKDQLKNSEMELKKFKELGKITYIDKEAEEIFRRITEAETFYNRTVALHDAAQKRYEVIQKKLANERHDLIPSITKTTSPWAQKLKENLIDLEVQYTTLKVQNYPEDHPKLKKIKDQIEETKKNLRDETLKIAQGENIVDPLSQIQNFLKELITLDIELKTYKAQKNTLEEILNTYNKYLISMPAKEMKLAQLNRNMTVNNQIYTRLLQRREEAKITDAEKMGDVRIIDPAVMPKKPIKPRKLLNTIIGILMGTMLGIGLALFLEQMDDTLKTVSDLEKHTEFSVLGSIPLIHFKSISKNGFYEKSKQNARNGIEDERYKLINNHQMKSQFVESFRSLRTYIQFIRTDTSIQSILVTSPNPQDGKSLIAANLGVTMAQMGLKTLLIDADLRKPVQHILFAKSKIPGLTNYLLSNDRSIEQKQPSDKLVNIYTENSIFQPFNDEDDYSYNNSDLDDKEELKQTLPPYFYTAVNRTDIDNLHLLTCGDIPLDPSAIISSNSMKNFIDSLKAKYDIIILDAPPIIAVTDPIILAPIVDGVIFVIKSGRNNKHELIRASTLVKVRGKIIGAVLNNVELGSRSYYYYYDSGGKKKRKQRVSR